MTSSRRWEDEGRRAGPWPAVTQDAILAVAGELAAAYPGVDAVFLFGSRAREEARASSDIDLAVLLLPDATTDDRISLEAELARFVEDRLGVPTDVVVVRPDLPPALLWSIFQREVILFARDEGRARNAGARARAEYRDLLPRLQRRYERARSRIKERADAIARS